MNLRNILVPSKVNILFSKPIRSKTKPTLGTSFIVCLWLWLVFDSMCGYAVIGHMFNMSSLCSGFMFLAWNRSKFIHCDSLLWLVSKSVMMCNLSCMSEWHTCVARMALSCSLLTLKIVLIQSHFFSESWKWVRTVKVSCLKARPRNPPTVALCSQLVDQVVTQRGLGARQMESNAVRKVLTCVLGVPSE